MSAVRNTPKFMSLSLRRDYSSESVFSNEDKNVDEETHIIPIYDCYAKDVPQGHRGDESCHYHIRDYANQTMKNGGGSFRDLIDPNLIICCRKGEIFFADSDNRQFKRFAGTLRLRRHGGNNIIGTLEEMIISL